jgi:hypothetical protein
MRKICGRLEKLGLPGLELLAAVEAHPGLPTRAHLANAMVAGGHVNRADEAFRKYLGSGKAANVAAEWPALDVVVGWIRAAGGVAALAHPARYALSAGARRQMLADFVAAGGAALEVVSGGNGAQHVEAVAALAVKYGLMGSVGSDFHDPQLTWNPLGRSLKLPDCVTPVWRSYINEAANIERLRQLRIEHRDLDDIISRLTMDFKVDELQMKRLKRRKLLLKDQIARLESQLIPDLNA